MHTHNLLKKNIGINFNKAIHHDNKKKMTVLWKGKNHESKTCQILIFYTQEGSLCKSDMIYQNLSFFFFKKIIIAQFYCLQGETTFLLSTCDLYSFTDQ